MRQRGLSAGNIQNDQAIDLMLGLSYPAETVLPKNNSRNRIFLRFQDSPRPPLGPRPIICICLTFIVGTLFFWHGLAGRWPKLPSFFLTASHNVCWIFEGKVVCPARGREVSAQTVRGQLVAAVIIIEAWRVEAILKPLQLDCRWFWSLQRSAREGLLGCVISQVQRGGDSRNLGSILSTRPGSSF